MDESNGSLQNKILLILAHVNLKKMQTPVQEKQIPAKNNSEKPQIVKTKTQSNLKTTNPTSFYSKETLRKENIFFQKKSTLDVTTQVISSQQNSNENDKQKEPFRRKSLTDFEAFKQKYLRKIKPRMNNKKKREILKKNDILRKLSCIRTKEALINFFIFLNAPWKNFIKDYLKKHFLRHLFIRPLKDPFSLMRQRQFIYDSIDNPENFLSNNQFSTNIIKNFCKGIVNFVIIYSDDLRLQQIVLIE